MSGKSLLLKTRVASQPDGSNRVDSFDINKNGLRFLSTVIGFLWMDEKLNGLFYCDGMSSNLGTDNTYP